MDYDEVLKFLRALNSEGVDYMLVGGVALGIHGLLRTTEDVDIFIRANSGNVEKLRRALRLVWEDPEIDSISESDLAGEYPVVRYAPPAGGPMIDIMARLGTEFRYEDMESQTMDIGGVTVSVATPQTLYRMKKGTVRAIDKADAEALRQKFGLEN